MFQHTATRRWLRVFPRESDRFIWFQHTATRRWLHYDKVKAYLKNKVSTHSHPKVAAIHQYYC